MPSGTTAVGCAASQHRPRSAALTASSPKVDWSTPLPKIVSALHLLALAACPTSQTLPSIASRRTLLCFLASVTLPQECEQGCRSTPFKLPAGVSLALLLCVRIAVFLTSLRRRDRLCTPGIRRPGPWRPGRVPPPVAQRREQQARCRMQEPLCQVGQPRWTGTASCNPAAPRGTHAITLAVLLAGGSKVQAAPFWESWRTKLTGKFAQGHE